MSDTISHCNSLMALRRRMEILVYFISVNIFISEKLKLI